MREINLTTLEDNGMMLSSLIAGFLTDQFGRKRFLIGGYVGIFVFTLIAGTSQTYETLLVAKFFEGVFFATSLSPTVTYTSEFCHKGIRDHVMLCQSSFNAVSQVLITAMAWGILTNDWSYKLFGGYIVLNTWNFYLYLMSLWSMTACLLYSLLPESPKYLVTQRRYDEAREILIKTYVMNTRKSVDTFPFRNIRKASEQVVDEAPDIKDTRLSHQLTAGLYNVKPMFSRPLVVPLILLSLAGCLTTAMYNVYRVWFPQLSTVAEHYGGRGDLCQMLDAYTQDLRNTSNLDTGDVCVPHPSGTETYINSMIVGAVSLLLFPITGLLVNRVGKKALLLFMGALCVGASFGLRWASSASAVVGLLRRHLRIAYH